jgi:glucose/arabinose dehydrogenase
LLTSVTHPRHRWLVALLTAGVLLASCGGRTGPTSNSESDALVAIGAGLQGREGLHATTYAGGLTHVAAFAFDTSGRLWVATAAYEDGGDDALYVVTAAGAAPKKVVSGLHTPLGLLWVDGALYVSSHERVDAYRGFDGTTFASATNIVTFPAGVGENNGLVLSPDGRILLGISAPCDACTPASEYSAAIVSFAPDGTDLRVHASGIRAPIGLAYYPGTSDLFVTMNQRDDLGDKTPGDWLAVVAAGSEWGFPDCYGQESTACASVPAPVATLDEHAAVSGVAIVTGELGRAVGNAAITAEWADGKLLEVALTPSGATYTATVSTFLTGIKNPVAVVVGPDGALYAGDWSTGSVYRIAAA